VGAHLKEIRRFGVAGRLKRLALAFILAEMADTASILR